MHPIELGKVPEVDASQINRVANTLVDLRSRWQAEGKPCSALKATMPPSSTRTRRGQPPKRRTHVWRRCKLRNQAVSLLVLHGSVSLFLTSWEWVPGNC